MDFICQKESNLDEENNFTIETSGNNVVEKEKFIGRDECLLSSLDLKYKDEGITKWTDYKKIEAFSNLMNTTKKKTLSNIDLTMVVKLPNSISFENRILKLMNEPEKVTYRYINTDTKKIDSITFQNFQKLFIENDMIWRNKNNKFMYTIRTPTGRDRIEQMTTKILVKTLILI